VTKLKIKGMTCGHCEQAVAKALAQVAGVSRVIEVSREREEAVVEGDAQSEALIAAVEEEGYGAEIVR